MATANAITQPDLFPPDATQRGYWHKVERRYVSDSEWGRILASVNRFYERNLAQFSASRFLRYGR